MAQNWPITQKENHTAMKNRAFRATGETVSDNRISRYITFQAVNAGSIPVSRSITLLRKSHAISLLAFCASSAIAFCGPKLAQNLGGVA